MNCICRVCVHICVCMCVTVLVTHIQTQFTQSIHLHTCVCVCVYVCACMCVCLHVYSNPHTIQEIWYFILMHYDMYVIVGIPKSVYPLHVHMK